jgi:tRNA-dihydrouridine synthase
MGCPDKSIEKQKSGSALIKHPLLAADIIRAAKRGAPNLPITVKTRLGYNSDNLEEWLPVLLKEEPAVVTIHARTRKEMSKVPAKWARLRRAVQIRDELESKTLIFGNGDVSSLDDAYAKAKESDVDGVMIGRAIFGNPWIFNKKIDKNKDVSVKQCLLAAVEHAQLFDKYLSHKNFAILKKHYKAYIEGFEGAKELRTQLMEEAYDSGDVERIVYEWLTLNSFSD